MTAADLLPWVGVIGTAIGAIVGGAVSFTTNNLLARRQRSHDALRAQVQELYAPVAALTAANRMMMDHASKLLFTAIETYGLGSPNVDWSDEEARKRAGRDTATTEQLEKAYKDRVVEYTRRIASLIKDRYHLIDAEDQPEFLRFLLDVERMEIEGTKDGIVATPFLVYVKTEPLLYIRDEFTQRVAARFAQKKAVLDG